MTKLCAIILAAGFSRRLGRNKLLVRIDGESVIRRSVRPFLNDFVERVIVVAGRDRDRVAEELKGIGCEIVGNPYAAEGMSTSVKAALPYLLGEEGAFFHLGDKPFVSPGLVRRMWDHYCEHGSLIVAPFFSGKRGHPILMKIRPFIEEMRGLYGDRGLREVIENHWKDVVSIEGDEGSVLDIDTIDDLRLLRARGHVIEEG